MKQRYVLAMIMAVIFAACGGGGEDAGTGDTQPAGNGAATSSTTTSPSDNGSPPQGSGSNTEFCEYLSDFDEQTDQAPSVTDPAEVEELFKEVADSLDRAQDLAPSEIEDDVEVIADAYDGFIEVLEENDYNFFALVSVIETDPRLANLDSEEFQTAGDNISAFCGLPDFGDDGGFDAGPPPTGGIDPGTVTSSSELPDDFPGNLEPPGVTSVESITLAAGFSVNIFTSESFDDLVDLYTEELGNPTVQIDEPDKSALWITGTLAVSIIDEGGSRLVNVTQTG